MSLFVTVYSRSALTHPKERDPPSLSAHKHSSSEHRSLLVFCFIEASQKSHILQIFNWQVCIPSKLPHRIKHIGSIESFLLHWNPKTHLSFSLLSCPVDPQWLDNICKLLTLLMKHRHRFLNRPSFCFTVDPDVAALIQLLELQAIVFQCLIQLNMADTLTLHLNQQKQSIMISPAIMANWFDLVQGAVDLFLLCPYRCVSQPQYASQACMCVCECVCQALSKQMEVVWAREPGAPLVL